MLGQAELVEPEVGGEFGTFMDLGGRVSGR